MARRINSRIRLTVMSIQIITIHTVTKEQAPAEFSRFIVFEEILQKN